VNVRSAMPRSRQTGSQRGPASRRLSASAASNDDFCLEDDGSSCAFDASFLGSHVETPSRIQEIVIVPPTWAEHTHHAGIGSWKGPRPELLGHLKALAKYADEERNDAAAMEDAAVKHEVTLDPTDAGESPDIVHLNDGTAVNLEACDALIQQFLRINVRFPRTYAAVLFAYMHDALQFARQHRALARVFALLESAHYALFDYASGGFRERKSADPVDCMHQMVVLLWGAIWEEDPDLHRAYSRFSDGPLHGFVLMLWTLWLQHPTTAALHNMKKQGKGIARSQPTGELHAYCQSFRGSGVMRAMRRFLARVAELHMPHLDDAASHRQRIAAEWHLPPSQQGEFRKRHKGDTFALASPRTRIRLEASDLFTECDFDKDGALSSVECEELMRQYLMCPVLSVIVGCDIVKDWLPSTDGHVALEKRVIACREKIGKAQLVAIKHKTGTGAFSFGHTIFERSVQAWVVEALPEHGGNIRYKDDLLVAAAEAIEHAVRAIVDDLPSRRDRFWQFLDRDQNGQVGQDEFEKYMMDACDVMLLKPVWRRARSALASSVESGALLDEELRSLGALLPRQPHGEGCIAHAEQACSAVSARACRLQ